MLAPITPIAVLLLVTGMPAARELSEHAEARRVRVPVLLEERAPGGCEGIGPDDIQLLEDGQAVEVTHFEAARLPAVHAVVIDTGPSMLETLHAARNAADAYVESLPSGEPALLATLDDQLILHAGLSTSRRRFRRALEWIETGFGSRVWDSLDRLVRHLASRPERKVLVLVSDGCETASLSDRGPEEVAATAARTESLVIYAVGVGLPPRCDETGADPLRDLERLARRTGGELFLAPEGSDLNSALAGIRLRTDQERYLTYKPLAFGRHPKDDPAKGDFRWRKRKIRLRAKRPCGISIAGPAERYESLSRRYPGRTPSPSSGVLAQGLRLNAAGDRLEGRLRGTNHPVSVLVPPLAWTVQADAGFETPLLFAAATAPEPSFLVDGSTLLDLLPSLGTALAQHTDYLDWARQKVKARRLAEIDEWIPRATGHDVELLREVRQRLDEQEWEPEALELQGYLANWLGDVWGVEARGIAERWLAGRVLDEARSRGPDAAGEATSRAERLWVEVRGWFPQDAPSPVRGFLVPAYDPVQESIGYYRVLLRLPRTARIHSTFTGATSQQMIRAAGGEDDSALHARFRSLNASEVPLGVRLVRWMLDRPDVSQELVGMFDVESVRYAHASARDLLPLLIRKGLAAGLDFEGGFPARQVTVVLDPSDDRGRLLTVSAYFAENPQGPGGYESDPVCLVLPPEPRHTAAYRLLRALAEAEQATPVPCLLQEARFDPD